ncbi:hypothetical protein [Sodalis sp.]|uniref:hypothetical protein n=1 Tax=Sodalis sp. (in: enterobacteria) TaxID=1898979 RepID=UPI003872E7DF
MPFVFIDETEHADNLHVFAKAVFPADSVHQVRLYVGVVIDDLQRMNRHVAVVVVHLNLLTGAQRVNDDIDITLLEIAY